MSTAPLSLRYGSVCSGTEAFGRAWHRLGFVPVFHAEIAKHPAAVLAHHYPTVPNHGDFTQIPADESNRVDLLCGGTPCQDFSLAGLRAGVAGDKGNLTLEFLRLVQRLGPRWVVWENVPGTFSSISHPAPAPVPPPPPLGLGSDGWEVETADEYDAAEQHAFEQFLSGLSELGYGVAYRVLDAQHAGVPQRRRRIVLVGYSGIVGRPAHAATLSERGGFSSVSAAVLFESHSLRGHTPPGREAGQAVAGALTASLGRCGGQQVEPAMGGHLQVVGTLPAGYSKNGSPDVDAGLYVYQCHGNSVGELGTLRTGQGVQNGVPFTAVEVSPTLEATMGRSRGAGTPIGMLTVAAPIAAPVAFDTAQITSAANRSNPQPGDPCHTLSAHGHPPAIFSYNKSSAMSMNVSEEVADTLRAAHSSEPAVFHQWAVRRLTPRECERLMGWPDDWTRWGVDAKGRAYEVPAGPRYEMCGNGWALPDFVWLGERIMLVEGLLAEMGKEVARA